MTRQIDIGICTFKRPHIAKTLHSLSQLQLPPGIDIRILVSDNDTTPSAKTVVETTAKELQLNVHYIHAPAHNISIARNACLDAAESPLLAFIDDDELASPEWLSELFTTMESSGAEIVLGPVIAQYTSGSPKWLSSGEHHSTYPVWVDGHIITGYAGNVLIQHESPPLYGLRFRHDLGKNGGEDTAFFSTAYESGACIAYATQAIAYEAVPKERANMQWLLKRRFNYGRIHGMLTSEKQSGTTLQQSIKASIKMGICYLMAFLLLLIPKQRRQWLLRGTLHAGVVTYLIKKNLCKEAQSTSKETKDSYVA